MLLEELKKQASLLVETYTPLSTSLRVKEARSEELDISERQLVRFMKEDLTQACWFVLFQRLCKSKGFVIVEVQTTKSVFYPNHFESFYRFCTKC